MFVQVLVLVVCVFNLQNSDAACTGGDDTSHNIVEKTFEGEHECTTGSGCPHVHSDLNSPCRTRAGYCSPQDVIEKHRREKILYVTSITLPEDTQRRDYLSVVDVDPDSEDYGKIIYRLNMPESDVKCELHHYGWNACSSCHHHDMKRDKLIFPCLNSDAIYIVDTTNERRPTHYKSIQPQQLHALHLSSPHTSHCLPTGEIMISTMGDGPEGNAKGQFLMIDGKRNFSIKGTFSNHDTHFGYDYWYQPCFDIMVSSEWGAPKQFKQGLNLSTLSTDFGHSITFWSWSDRKFKFTLDLGTDHGWLPLETRFLHSPYQPHGYVGTALSSTVFHINKASGEWGADLVISVPSVKVENWWLGLDQMPGVITDILISMDDRFLYFSNWVQGDIRQYDITDRSKPVLVGQVFVGGSLVSAGRCPQQDYESPRPVRVLDTNITQPEPLCIDGKRVEGGPQMLQISLDGKRLYVTTSLFSKWDTQFYPELVKRGSWLLLIDVDTEKGGLTLNKNFGVDYGAEPGGPTLAHEIRYPGGDCSSDIFRPNPNSQEAHVCVNFSH